MERTKDMKFKVAAKMIFNSSSAIGAAKLALTPAH